LRIEPRELQGSAWQRELDRGSKENKETTSEHAFEEQGALKTMASGDWKPNLNLWGRGPKAKREK